MSGIGRRWERWVKFCYAYCSCCWCCCYYQHVLISVIYLFLFNYWTLSTLENNNSINCYSYCSCCWCCFLLSSIIFKQFPIWQELGFEVKHGPDMTLSSMIGTLLFLTFTAIAIAVIITFIGAIISHINIFLFLLQSNMPCVKYFWRCRLFVTHHSHPHPHGLWHLSS